MSTSFLKEQMNKKENEQQESNKNEFRDKIIHVLGQIKELNEERYHELNRLFHQGYDRVNVQKKKLLGLHGQLLSELKTLREKAGISVASVSHEAKSRVDSVKKTTKKMAKEMAKQVTKEVNQVKKEAVAQVKEVKKELKKGLDSAKKTVKKASDTAKKKAVKKAAPVGKKKVAKKVVKNAAPSGKKKVAKKAKKK